ncbi:MAG: HD domain-containing protein [Synergistaceae bacterium]
MATLQTIQEIKKTPSGTAFKAIVVVNSIFQKTDKNGKPYYEISVSDDTSGIDAKIWSDAAWFDRSDINLEPSAPSVILPDTEITSVTGQTVGVEGKTSEYRGQLQFNFNKITLLNQEKFMPSQFLPRSPLPLNDLVDRYENLVNSCRKELSDFLRYVYKDELWTQFRDWPAAVSHHHAYANGLLEHSLSVASGAKAMAESMKISGYNIDIDIVITGALLHDLGKIASYKMKSIPEITLEGAILDHIAIGYAKFMNLAEDFGLSEELKLHLGHIILSHHGQREFGSPVVPVTPEAMIISSADELDFRMFCWNDSTKDLSDNQNISQWNNSTGRRFWNKQI